MIRKIKALGLAVAALAAFAASAVQASELHITSGANTGIFGERLNPAQQEHSFTLQKSNAVAKCQQALFESSTITGPGGGAQQTTLQEVTVTGTYTGGPTAPLQCTLAGVAATIHMNGCKYRVTGGPTKPANQAQVDITGCTAAKPRIEITTALGCNITVPEQTTIAGSVTASFSPPELIIVVMALQGIKYEGHGGVGVCPAGLADTMLTADGTYVGQASFRVRIDPGHEQKTHNGDQYEKLKQQGAEVGLVST